MPEQTSAAAPATAADVMRPLLTTVEQQGRVAAAAYLMKHAGATALMVLDAQTDQPIGIITEANIARRACHVTGPQLADTAQGTDRPRRRGLTLLLLASIIVSFLAASSVPTPLYALYAAQWGFSPLATTVVFGVYALAVLASLLTFGKLSDHVGRRPVLLTVFVLQAVAMVLFATAGGLGMLLGARIVQGVATGLLLGAAGAAMLDLDRRRGALANSSAPGADTAAGALISALAVRYLPAPTHLIYLVLLGALAAQAAGVLGMGETAPSRPGALRSSAADLMCAARAWLSASPEPRLCSPDSSGTSRLEGFSPCP